MRIDPAFAEDLIKHCLRLGADEAEVFQKAAIAMRADARNGALDAIETDRSYGFGLRTLTKGRLGFYYSADAESPEAAVRAALEGGALTGPDEHLSFPTPGEAGDLPGVLPDVYDPAVAGVTEADALKAACAVEKAAREFDPRIDAIRKASASFASVEYHVSNSHGLARGGARTSCSASVMVAAREGEDTQMGYGFASGRHLRDVDFPAAGVDAARRATGLLGARRITPLRAMVVLDSLVAAEFLGVLAEMLDGDNVVKGKSLLAGKVGRQIISKHLCIVDDGLHSGAPGAIHTDDEGVAASRTPLFVDGVLQGFMHSGRSARMLSAIRTGNAMRGGYGAMPAVHPTNLFIEPCEHALNPDALITEMGTGVLITDVMGLHTVNPVSGDFSVGVSGMYCQRGERAYPVREAVLSGNLLDFFMNVQALGTDFRFHGTIGAPSLLIGPAEISA
jgi:PmbA protein